MKLINIKPVILKHKSNGIVVIAKKECQWCKGTGFIKAYYTRDCVCQRSIYWTDLLSGAWIDSYYPYKLNTNSTGPK